MNINYYIGTKTGISPELEQEVQKFLNDADHRSKYSNKNIGFIDWWWCTKEQRKIDNLKQFVESQDLCFFVNEELICYLSHGVTYSVCDDILTMLNNYNVYFLMFSEEDFNVSTDPKKTLSMPWFFKRHLVLPENFTADFDYTAKPYTFNLLLGSEKHYRTILYLILKHNPSIYATYLGHHKYKYDQKNILDNDEIKTALLGQDVSKTKLNTMLDTSQGEISHIIPDEIYRNSHFDIVSESQADQNTFFTTEKTAKPLATGRFFIYVGRSKVFEYLKSYGFSFTNYLTDYVSKEEDYISRLSYTSELITEITENPNMVKDIYAKTRSERIHNMQTYKKHTKHFYEKLRQWFYDCLLNS